ncbi:MAG: Methyltransferase, HemK family [uncultured bacterium]|nr:MAG: Methyltransferase, HemK family [uncultured bacterium]HLD45345.1 HemK/PrmC family methyltransferase [bacterium]
MSDPWTILRIIQWTIDYFKQKGFDTPRLDAEVIIAHALGLKKIDLYLQFERLLQEDELAHVKTLIKRRINHEPVAYLTGKKEFWSREFVIDENVFIPRPDTEIVVEQVLEQVKKRGWQDNKLLGFEACLGSGCLAITLCCELPQLTMQAIEISPKAIEIAKKNAEKFGVVERLNIVKGDVFRLKTKDQRPTSGSQGHGVDGSQDQCQETSASAALRSFCPPFDFLIANPPYIALSEKDQLPQSVRGHEPHLALFADNEGLAFYPKIAEFAKNYLRDDGFVAVEIGEQQGRAVKDIFESADLHHVMVKKDYAGKERVVIGNRESLIVNR